MIRFYVCLLLVGFTVGCANKAEEPLHPVVGRVMFHGKPLHKGDIMLVPDTDKGNTHLQYGSGKIGADGGYTARTFQKGGVKAGWYKVTVLATENEPQDSLSWIPIWIVPEKYTKAETTSLSVEVVSNPQPGRYDFVIEP